MWRQFFERVATIVLPSAAALAVALYSAAIAPAAPPAAASSPPRPPLIDKASIGPATPSPKRPAKSARRPNENDPFGPSAAATSKTAATPKGSAGPRAVAESTLRIGEQAIDAALDRPIKLLFSETPLSDVFEYLQERCRIRIVLDRKALESAGVAADTPITADLVGVKLASALDLILGELDLAWTVQSEVLLITTSERAEGLLVTKVYEVADLVVFRDEHDKPWDDFQSLCSLIASHTKPASWQEAGGCGAMTGTTVGAAKVLVVSHTYPVHREIRKLLADLRETAGKSKGDGRPPLRSRP